jgi:LysM repeat protein
MDTEALTNRLGPLPVWGWLALGTAGLYYYEKHRGGAGTGQGGIISGIFGNGSGQGANVAAANTSGTQAAADASASDTNQSWGNDAIQYLTGQGYTQSQAQSAVGSYLTGSQLDPSQATLVDVAAAGIGNPPQLMVPIRQAPQMPTPTVPGTTGGTSAGATGVAQNPYVKEHEALYQAKGARIADAGPTDKTGHHAYFQYTTKKGDTLATIGQQFGSSPTQLKSWNSLKSNRAPKPGTKIWV